MMIPRRSFKQSLVSAFIAMLSTHYLMKLTGVDRAAQPVKFEIVFFGMFAVIYFGSLYLPLLWKKPEPPTDGPTP